MTFPITKALDILQDAFENANKELKHELPDLENAALVIANRRFPTGERTETRSNLRVTTKPALKSLSLPILKELRSTLRINADDPDLIRWANKVLRVCEVRKTTLRERLSEGLLDLEGLQHKALLLKCFMLEYFQKTNDARFVNFVLKLNDQRWMLDSEKALKLAMANSHHSHPNAFLALASDVLLESSLHKIKSAEFKSPPPIRLEAFADSVDTFEQLDCTGQKRVVILSPSKFSLQTLLTTELLRRNQVKIDAIIVRKLINPKRAILEFRRDGIRLIRKIWNKLILRRRAYQQVPFDTLPQLLASLEIHDQSIVSLANRNQIPLVFCKTLNDKKVHDTLKSTCPDAVVFTGGGIIREKTLGLSGHGVINCHMGQLPNYRGMDVVEWPLLENQVGALGFTVHFMKQGIDTGDILAIFPMDTTLSDSISVLRKKYETHMCCSFVKTVTHFLNGDCKRHVQNERDGKQYFIIHERLRRIGESRLKKRSSDVENIS